MAQASVCVRQQHSEVRIGDGNMGESPDLQPVGAPHTELAETISQQVFDSADAIGGARHVAIVARTDIGTFDHGPATVQVLRS